MACIGIKKGLFAWILLVFSLVSQAQLSKTAEPQNKNRETVKNPFRQCPA